MASELGIKSGIRSAFRGPDTPGGNFNYSNDLGFFMARVSFVLLDDSDKDRFDKYGGWKSIGTVECITFIDNNANTNIIPAKPINPNLTQFPLINEVVLVFRGISYKAQNAENNYQPEYYYTTIIPGWNAVEQNAIPNRITSQDQLNNITGIFKSTGKVNRVIKAPGDITVEGRSGNYIRFGSSVEGFNSPYRGKNRAPLISIVNGQRQGVEKEIAIYEDINSDGSSLYMLNGQSVGFKVASSNFDSYKFKIDTNVLSNYIQPTKITSTEKDDLSKVVDTPVETKEVVNAVTNIDPQKESAKQTDEVVFDPVPDAGLEEEAFDLTSGDIVDLNQTAESAPEEEKVTSTTDNNNISSTLKWQLQEGGTWCYVASCSMLLKSYGISEATQQNIYKNCVDSKGKLLSDKVAKIYGVRFRIEALPSGQRESYNRIVEVCKQRNNRPFILQRRGSTSKYPNHFVVVRGQINGVVHLFDPGKRQNSTGTELKLENLLPSGGSLRFFDR